MLREYLTDIANAIRAKLGTTDTINAQDFSSKVDEVYEAGRKDEYDAFWDTYPREQYDMTRAFGSFSWNSENFRPKVSLKPQIAPQMFMTFDFRKNKEPLDFVTWTEKTGLTLDLSTCTNLNQAFSQANISRFGVIDLSKCNGNQSYGIFSQNDVLHTIEKLIIPATLVFSSIFYGTKNLENLTIEGTIGKNGFSVAQSTLLSKPSIKSIIEALSTTTSGLTVTLSKTAVNNAFETSEGANDGSTSAEWSALEATKTNWTISLA